MAVNITWSLTNGGAAISTNVDHGTKANGEATTEQEIFIKHDGANPLTNCGFYLAEKSGSYTGDDSSTTDLADMFSWGDGATTNAFGGFQLNMDAVNSYVGSWPTYSSKSGSSWNVFRTGVGDSKDNKIILPTAMGLSSIDGVIQAGIAPNIRFKCRIAIPTDEDTGGVRQFDQRLRYTFTS